jgi:hypothetical protein
LQQVEFAVRCPAVSYRGYRRNGAPLCVSNALDNISTNALRKQVKSHSVEMSVSEFNEFVESLNSIVAVLDTL